MPLAFAASARLMRHLLFRTEPRGFSELANLDAHEFTASFFGSFHRALLHLGQIATFDLRGHHW
jgi:hypothetical protein